MGKGLPIPRRGNIDMIFGDIIYLPHNTIKTLEEVGGVFNGDIGVHFWEIL